MSIIKSNMTASPPAAAGGGPVLSSISEMNSLRFDGTSYLSRTPSSASNRKTWTYSCWFKRSVLDVANMRFFGAVGGSVHTEINISSDNKLFIYEGSSNTYYYDDRLLRDTSAWYHAVVIYDTTQSAMTDKCQFYLNGEIDTSNSQTNSGISTDQLGAINNVSTVHRIGSYSSTGFEFEGYLANIHFIDGQALDANAFGEEISGVWVPKQYGSGDPTDTATVLSEYGQNGFHLDFADSGNIGNDVSGNGNHWAVN